MSGSGIGFGGVALSIASSVFAPTWPSIDEPVAALEVADCSVERGTERRAAVQAEKPKNLAPRCRTSA